MLNLIHRLNIWQHWILMIIYHLSGNAAASGDAYRHHFEKLYGIGDYSGSNTEYESYRNTKNYNIQKDVYSSVSHNHDLSVSGGTEKTKVLIVHHKPRLLFFPVLH